MKFNWGIGIAIFYLFFMAAMISVVIGSCYNTSDLVKEDYYQLDLDYEEHRQKKTNVILLKEKVKIDYEKSSNSLSVSFPDTMKNISGDIHLFRPSDKSLDVHYALKLNDQNQIKLSLDDNIRNGLWLVKLDWEGDGIPYFINSEIII